MERKLIKMRNEKKEIEIREMNCNEAYEQFKNYVIKTAHGFNNSTETMEDLIQIGNVALVKAFDSYNIETGNMFMTYLATVVTNCFLMLIRKERNKKRILNEISFEEKLATDESGNVLTLLDVIHDPIKCEDIILKNGEHEELRKLVEGLKPNRAKILKMVYFGEMEQLKVGEILDFSQGYVSRTVKRSIKELKIKYDNLEKKEMRSW